MSLPAAAAAERAVNRLVARLAADPQLHAELQRARREYYGVASDIGPALAAAPELRFREWFVCERESERHGAVPLELPLAAEEAEELADSVAGLWLVRAAAAGGVAAVDLQDDSVVDLTVPAGSLQAGDLIVGRLYPVGAGRFVPSVAAAVFRPGVALAEAFARDLARLSLDRRLLQVELERLLLQRQGQSPAGTVAAPPLQPLEHLEADLDALLQRAGARHAAAALSQQLAAAQQLGTVLGPVLDELAFETGVDLDRARELLVRIWNAHHAVPGAAPAGAPAADPSAAPSLGERLAQTLEQGLAARRDLGALFGDVERLAGIEPDPEDGEGADEDADDGVAAPLGDGAPVGNLAPLVEEYLWETSHEDSADAAVLRQLASLQQQAAMPRVDLEDLTATDVLRVLLHVYLAAPPAERALRTRAAMGTVAAFCRWAETTQELPMQAVLDGVRGGLVDDLDRLEAAGLALSSPAAGDLRPGMMTIDEVRRGGFGASDDDGGGHWLMASGDATSHLRAGDLVLGALRRTTGGAALAGLVVVLPADARALIE